MTTSPEFTYLKWIGDHYEKWWTVDALTETIAARQATFTFEQRAQTEEICKEAPDRKEKISLPLLQGINKYAEKEHVLLVGLPGIGKSTTLLRLLVNFARQELEKPIPRIPVLIRLKRYEKPAPGSEDRSGILALIKDTLEPNLSLEISAIEKLLFQERRFILLLDGLNEMRADTELTELTAFRDKCDRAGIPLICTTRELGDTLGIKRRLEIQPLMLQGEIQRFLDECMPFKKQEVLQLLDRDTRELSRTPFVLWMLYDSFQQTGDVERTMGDAFQKFFQSFRGRKEDASVPSERRRQWDSWSEHLSFSMLNSPDPRDQGLVIREEQAEKILTEKFGAESPSRINELMNHYPLQEVSHRKIGFHHQLIQEYYAAEYLLREVEQHPEWLEKTPDQKYTQFQWKYLNYRKWTQPIALMLGLADEGLAMRVVELAIGVDLMLGARLAGEVKQGVQEKTVRNVLDLDVPQSLKFQLLGATHSSIAVPSLINVLQVEEYSIYQQFDAASALRALGSQDAVSSLIWTLAQQHKNEITIATAAFALGSLGDHSAIPALLSLLNHPNPHVRRNAVSSLGELHAKSAVPQLIEKLGDDQYVTQEAIKALGEIGDEDAIPELIKTVLSSNHLLSWNASNALKRINSEKASEDLLGFLKEDKNYRISGKAAEALGEIGCESAVKALFNALNDGHVGWASAEALKKIGSSAAISALLKALQSPNPSACGWAIHALGELGDSIAVEGLIGVLAHWDCSVVEEAVEALGKIGDKTTIPPLLRFLQDEEYKTRRPEIYQKAVIALGKLGSNSAKPKLLKILEDQSPYIQPWLWAQICDALENLGGEDVVTGFLKTLKSANHSYLRWLSAQALGNLGNKAASEGLLYSLKDEDSSIRFHAAKALGKLPSQKIIPMLFKLLEDENPKIREAAIKALGALRAEESVPKLLEILEKEECDIRYDAIEALKEIGSVTALDKLQELQRIMDDNFVYAIDSIQKHCQFYNYEIFLSKCIPRLDMAKTPASNANVQQSILTNVRADQIIINGNIIQTANVLPQSDRSTPLTNTRRTILILAASPTDQVRLRLDQEVRDIDKSLRRSLHRDRFTLQSQWAVRPRDLRRALLDYNPKIVQFCGHGEGEQGIVLENETGKSQLVSTEAIADLFKLFADKGLECVVLNACYSEVQANAIAQYIPYVIGMSDAIFDKTALKFAVGFYDALGAGWSCEQAFEMGKSAIAMEGIPEADLPILKQK
jgi:HEAT repeat protein